MKPPVTELEIHPSEETDEDDGYEIDVSPTPEGVPEPIEIDEVLGETPPTEEPEEPEEPEEEVTTPSILGENPEGVELPPPFPEDGSAPYHLRIRGRSPVDYWDLLQCVEDLREEAKHGFRGSITRKVDKKLLAYIATGTELGRTALKSEEAYLAQELNQTP